MSTMLKIINPNVSYGDRGPFEAESIDVMVASMRHSFATWAMERYQGYLANFDNREGEPVGKSEFLAIEIDAMVIDFENDLEIVGRVVDGYDMDALDGDHSVIELVRLRSGRVYWGGDRNVEAEKAIRDLCEDALNQIGQDGEAVGAEFKGGRVVGLLVED